MNFREIINLLHLLLNTTIISVNFLKINSSAKIPELILYRFVDFQNAALLKELENLRQEKEDKEKELENDRDELQGDVAKMRAEMEAIMQELQLIMDTKLGLELEIAAYRKLLEGEEER